MYIETTNSKDELEISELFASELITALKIIFSKLPFREIGPLIIDDILYRLDAITHNRKEFTAQELVFINIKLKKLFHILADCITNDPKYKEEFLNYKSYTNAI